MTKKDHKAGSTASLRDKLGNEETATQNVDEVVTGDSEELLEHPSYRDLQNKLNEAEAKANQYWDRMLRMQADSDNVKRRCERDVENAHKYALEKFALELLPIMDSLERATSIPEQPAEVLEGVNLTLRMLKQALEKFGVEQVDPISQPFNPDFQQAVSTQEDSSVKPGTVLSVLQKGYLLNKRLIRPALVVVSKG